MDAAMVDRVKGALWGVFIADALAMPVHWFYNPAHITRQFSGGIRAYEAPRPNHPSSIMDLSSTGGHGRGGQEGSIIGDVINHGKKQFWGVSGMHYHQGMVAGENTLNALCTRVVLRSIARTGGIYSSAAWLEDYVQFMTTAGSHNDTYAESFHRDFFKNWKAGRAAAECARGTEAHNTAQIGGFVMLPPVVASAVRGGNAAVEATALQHLRTTHDSRALESKAAQFSTLLAELLRGTKPATALKSAGLSGFVHPEKDDMEVVYRKYGPACYIDSSLPVAIHLFSKYSGDFKAGVLANANVGGENCHRGAAVGALIGAAVGESGIPEELISGLHDWKEIRSEIDCFVESLQAQP